MLPQFVLSLLSPILTNLGKIALRMVTAQALEDFCKWTARRLRDHAKSIATQELVDVVEQNLSRKP